jgi:anti-anti-sigma regulatory factor
MPKTSRTKQQSPGTQADMADQAGHAVKEDRLVVEASGAFCVAGCAAFRRILLEALDRSDWIEVDCRALTDADVTFFQTLCAANRSATAQGKKFTLQGRGNARFTALTGDMGLARHDIGTRDRCRRCIWAEEDTV